MQRKHIVILLGAILLIAIVAAVPTLSGFFALALAEDNSIKIGAVLPLTGNSALWGERSREGIDLALEEINAAGGINGKELKVIYEDDLSNAAEAAKALQKLISIDEVNVVIGSVNSPETLAMAPIAEEKKIIIIAPGSSSPKMTSAGDYIFRTRVSAEVESIKISELLVGRLKIRNLALLYRNDDYGHGVGEAVKKYFENLGGSIKQTEVFAPGAGDFKTELLKIKAGSPQALLIAASPKEVGLIAKQMMELGIGITVVIHSGSKGPEIFEVAGKAANGIIALNTFDMRRTETMQYSGKYSEKYGKEAENFSALAYDALKIIAGAMKECGTNTGCIKNWLYQLKNYAGTSGMISFDANGDVLQPFIAEVLRDGKFAPYED